MLQLNATFLNKPVLSLRTGGVIAQVYEPIINPDNLKIEGFYCTDRFNGKTLVLLYQDIRETNPKGYVVNDHDVLTDSSDLIRLKEIINIHYRLIGKPVITVSKDRIGKINDFAIEIETFYIQKLYVTQPLLKSFSGGNLSIDRNQVQEVTDTKIIINDLLKRSLASANPVVA